MTKRISRRNFVTGGLSGCLACAAPAAVAKILAPTGQPAIGTGYVPVEQDERGLWLACREFEEKLVRSDLLLDAPDLLDYSERVMQRLLGPAAADLRIHIVRDPDLNASMFPNGMLLVHTGLLARLDSEAQYASILGHEAGHYFLRHGIERYRDVRGKAAIASVASLGLGALVPGTGMVAYPWIGLVGAVNSALLISIANFAKDQEAEADAFGIGLMDAAGYRTAAAAEVWRQYVEERTASAALRDSMFAASTADASTHPPSGQRILDLAETAMSLEIQSGSADSFDGYVEWRGAIEPHLQMLLYEQVKLNDPGASLTIIERHSRRGWNGVLRYCEGEAYRLRGGAGDEPRAASAYAAAVGYPDAPADAWRAHGYALRRTGRVDEGNQALAHYLSMSPNARDAAMVRFTIGR